VFASESDDGKFHIASNLWKDEVVCESLSDLPSEQLRTPLLFALYESQKQFGNPPLRIRVQSNLDSSAGLGSSSAVILGACAVSSKEASLLELSSLAFQIQKTLQGNASGYDVLTQALGGVICMKPNFKQWPGTWDRIEIQKHTFSNYIHLFAGGKGSATGPLLNKTLIYLSNETIRKSFLKVSSQLTDSFLSFFENEHAFSELLKSNRLHRNMLSQFPSFPKELAAALENLKHCDETWSFKTTGAGGEDSILLLGKKEDLKPAMDYLNSQNWYPIK
jgi:mevalonate kinase